MLHSVAMPELLGSIVDQVRLTTVIDIGLTALLIYWLFSLIRGTRAVRLVIGVSVLFMVYVLAVSLGLRLMTRILEAGAVVGLFAVVVVFQPELRRALERIGRVGSIRLAPVAGRIAGRRPRRGGGRQGRGGSLDGRSWRADRPRTRDRVSRRSPRPGS